MPGSGREEPSASFEHRLRKEEADQVLDFNLRHKQGKIQTNYDNVDQYLCRFGFFKKYSKEIRKELLQNCEVKVFEQDQVIFRQGDGSPDFFFILRGTVSLSIERFESCEESFYFKTLYDG